MWRPTERIARQMEEQEQHPPTKLTTGDEKRWWRDGGDNNDDDDDEPTTTTTTTTRTASGNVDSGFLSSGNLQISGEIGDSATGLQIPGEGRGGGGLAEGEREEEGAGTWERKRRVAPTTGTTATPVPTAVSSTSISLSSSSSSASSAATTIAEPMRADSGLVADLGLSESLSQLSLKQVALNPLASSGGRGNGAIQTEPILELSPVIPPLPPSHHHTDHGIRNSDVALPESQVVRQQQQQQQQQRQDNSRGDSDTEQQQRAANNEEPWQLYYTQDDDGDTQLHIAIVQGFAEAAFSLIRMAPHPCLLNCLNDDWQSPLHLAVLTHQPMIVRRLILAGADPSVRSFRGNTALHLACTNGDLACAKALTEPLSPMERNELMPGQTTVPAIPQNLEQRNYSGEMCLHVAAANGHVDLVRLLLRLGADLEAREALAGKTALHIAVERGCRTVIAFLLQECRPCLDAQTYAGTSAYQLALCFDDSQLARELVRFGASPQPLPESSDSDSSSEDEEASLETSSSSSSTTPAAGYLPALVQNAVGVKV